MTPSKQIKAAGLPEGLNYVSKKTGVSRQTLRNWHINKPELFNLIVKALVYEYQNKAK